MKSPQFYKCTLDDLEYLRELSLTTFVEAFGSRNEPEDMEIYCQNAFNILQIKAELENENSLFYFVKSSEIIVGYFKINVESAQTETIEGGLEIERIYLLSPYQGIGIGQIMFDKIFKLARKMNKNHLWLGVWEKNSDAIRFYERNGFKEFDKHKFLLGNDLQTDIMMELILTMDEES